MAGLGSLLVGCTPWDQVRARATTDMSCPGNRIRLTKLTDSSFLATGCAQQVTYVWTVNGWRPEVPEPDDSAVSAPSGSDRAGRSSPRRGAPRAGGAGERTVSQGTGFRVDAGGLILTANHVVEHWKNVSVQCGREERTVARVVKRDAQHDLALLRTDQPGSTFLPLGYSAAAALGEQVFTVGFPVSQVLGREPKFTEGTISALKGVQDSDDLFQVSVPIQPGNSGGPLVGKAGNVIGVITSTASVRVFFEATGALPQGVNWAVKSDLAYGLVNPTAPSGPPPTREEAIARARNAVCMIVAGDTDDSVVQKPPDGAGGFRFGITTPAAEQLCRDAGGAWTAGEEHSCSVAPASVGFEADIRLRFCNDALCAVTLVPRKQRAGSAEQIAFYERVTAAITKRYGEGERDDDIDGMGCEANRVFCVEQRHGLRRTAWKWPSKPWIIAKIDVVEEGATMSVTYLDVPAQPKPRTRRSVPRPKKPPAPVAPPGL
ncbi:MAG: trypsin-like peptidase domain-containing protein [Deltaproteobacteria bacterium]|nr:trypsin-like peptidase domain-containing protein [Deltaproteobacteria bacterium]